MTDWPSSLPDYPKVGTFSETRSGQVRSFQPELGRPINSAANTLQYQNWSGVYEMTDAQLTAFWVFWDTTLTKGVGEFNMLHPRTKLEVSVEFQDLSAPPSAEQVTKNLHSVALSFRVVG